MAAGGDPQLPPIRSLHSPTVLPKRDCEPQDDAPSPAAPGSNKRSRINGSTSARGVANLTPDQLAKKRANDREAQRAIRERTRNQISELEQRIRNLMNQQPYQDLQHVLRQKEALEAENAAIKKKLGEVIGLLQSLLGHNG